MHADSANEEDDDDDDENGRKMPKMACVPLTPEKEAEMQALLEGFPVQTEAHRPWSYRTTIAFLEGLFAAFKDVRINIPEETHQDSINFVNYLGRKTKLLAE